MSAPAQHERQPTLRSFARMVVCFHEAGHAVALWEADTQVDVLTVQQGWFSASAAGRTRVKPGQSFDDESPDESLPVLVSLLAGRVAHERFEVEYGISMEDAPIPPGTDREMMRYAPDARAAAISAEAGCESDMMEFHSIAARCGLSYSFALQQTEILIDRKWSKVTEVAQLLFARGRLPGSAARG